MTTPLVFIQEACEQFKVDIRKVLGKNKQHKFVDFRAILMQILYDDNRTQKEVGVIFNIERSTLSYNKWNKKPITHFSESDIEKIKQIYEREKD